MRAPNIDIFDPDLYVAGVPHDAFRVLRAEAHVYRHAEPDGVGFWAITKYHDIVSISKDPGTFSSWPRPDSKFSARRLSRRLPETRLWSDSAGSPRASPSRPRSPASSRTGSGKASRPETATCSCSRRAASPE